MSGKLVSPAAEARRERQRLAAEEGAKALAEYAAEAIAVRENMSRLRALRLAKMPDASARSEPRTKSRAKP
ncbi:MAG: hypothetical protein DCC74_03860 [Proteobacteria bacterium]|nr:MAG: hypothetical protein DCC74_03860 [Pseudomonadota bacterium]